MSHPYETPEMLEEYLLFHYATQEELLPWPFGPKEALGFAQRVANELLPPGQDQGRALDLGCAVGGTSFELARTHREVIGLDFSHRFIAAAGELARRGELATRRREEGACFTPVTVRVPEGVDRSRVRFEWGDAMNLDPARLGRFDTVVAANLLCRLPEPGRCLERLPELVRPGGSLAITTPGTWMETYTPREHWLGGFEREGIQRHTLDGLQEALGGAFTLERTLDLPFLIREHARKYQWSVAQGSLWRRAG